MNEQKYKEELRSIKEDLLLTKETLKEIIIRYTKDYKNFSDMTNNRSVQLLQQQTIIIELRKCHASCIEQLKTYEALRIAIVDNLTKDRNDVDSLYMTLGGTPKTRKELADAIRKNNDEGIYIMTMLINLTIDLLHRKKELL